jgi:hypothetical protein
LLGLLVSLQACQHIQTVDHPNNPTASPPIVANTSPPMPTPVIPTTGIGPSGLTGQVISASDVSGQPDEPLPGQSVLAIPIEKADEILGGGTSSLTNEKLRFWAARLPQKDPAIGFVLSDAAGKYTLILNPGEYILCVADSEKSPPDFPMTTRGCGRVQVPPGNLRRLDISRGFGEILLVGQ